MTGTNSWIVGEGPAWLVDPGPLLEEHVRALEQELARRGGVKGIVLTHDHLDHAEALPAIRERFPGPIVGAARGDVTVQLTDGSRLGPFEAVSTPGHAPDHLTFIAGRAAMTGDAVLGEGSVFISPDPGALASYLDGLERLRHRDLTLICPGHGPPVHDVVGKLDEYISHRLDRERRLMVALDAGKRSIDELLDDVWADAPAPLRPAAMVTLAAHLDKLEGEGRLPDGVERPTLRF